MGRRRRRRGVFGVVDGSGEVASGGHWRRVWWLGVAMLVDGRVVTWRVLPSSAGWVVVVAGGDVAYQSRCRPRLVVVG